MFMKYSYPIPSDESKTQTQKKIRSIISDGFVQQTLLKRHEGESSIQFSPGGFLLSAFILVLKRHQSIEEVCINFQESPGQGRRNSELYSPNSSFLKIQIPENPTFVTIEKNICELARIMLSMNWKFSTLFDTSSISVSFNDNRERNNTIEFLITAVNQSITASISYTTDLPNKQLVSQLHDHYFRILDQVAKNPTRRFSEYKLLSYSESEKILYDWNDTETLFKSGVCLHRLIEEQAERTPLAIAAYYKNQSITYKEVNERANALAYKLIDLGVAPDDPVAVLLDLSFDALVAVLSILKAGGAYLPLHMDYPEGRLNFIVSNAKPKAIITSDAKKDHFQFDPDRIILAENQVNNLHGLNPETSVSPDNLAYIIYTSGSTGNPKGVMIRHSNVVNNVGIIIQRYHLSDQDTVLSMPSLAFDASVSKLFPILSIGGSVVLPTSEESRNVESVLDLVHRYGCPYFAATPSFIRLVNALNPDLSGLRMITSGGETLRYSDISNIVKQVEVLNVYGPTEATVSSCSYKVQKNTIGSDARVPIGKPNPNCKIYILDQCRNPVPIGCFGSLYIGGKGVGKGYLNDPELTREKFIPDPFNPDEILYNSGDIARWLPDGKIDFLGRVDDQVKFRGFRISLEEIESNLASVSSVHESKLIVYENESRDQSLVAFFVPVPGEAVSIPEIRKFLQEKLPAYAIPSKFIQLSKIPLNQNNKVDVKALREYLSKEPTSEANGSTIGIEAEISSFCRQLLNRERVESGDNFFHIGGHSLHAMQLKLFISRRFNVNIPVREIFECPVIGELTERILSYKDNQLAVAFSQLAEPDIQKMDTSQENFQPLTFGEKRVWFLYKLHENKAVYNIVNPYLIKGELNLPALEKSLIYLIHRHDNLRKTFVELNGEPWAKVLDKPILKIEKISLNSSKMDDQESMETVEKIISQEKERAFDLATDLPVRIHIIRLAKTKTVLILSFHHIIADAWSFTIFSRELQQLYLTNLLGKKAELPSLENRYRNYPAHQPPASFYTKSMDYWKRTLEDKVSPLNLPYDFHQNNDRQFSGGMEEILIPQALVNELEDFSRKNDVTLFMTFFAALQSLLRIYTQNSHIHTAIPIAGRQEDTTDLFGFFVNTLILTTNFQSDSSFLEILNDVRKTLLDAQENKDLPYELLANELRKEYGINAESLIQIMFTFQSIQDSLSLSDLEVEKLHVPVRFVKFDLTVSVENTGRGYLISAEYKSSRFKASTIRRLLDCYRRMLDLTIRQPKTRLTELSLLTKSEYEHIIRGWNRTYRVIPDLAVHQLFELQVSLTPDSPALVYNDAKHYSYDQLNQKANCLARKIISMKKKHGELVAILMDETDEAIISMIAILKSGCGYLPLDPDNPTDRLQTMLALAGVNLVLTNRPHLSRIKSRSYQTILVEETLGNETTDAWQIQNPGEELQEDNLAYVMYTSGSTGTPKAVGIGHRAIVRLIMNTNYLNLRRTAHNTRLLKTGAFSFDASTFEVWGMLLHGGALFVYPKRDLLSPSFLKTKIAENDITIMWFTTSWFNELAETDPSIFHPLKTILIGGEKLSARHINLVKKENPGAELFNMYGPTENTTFSLFYKMDGEQTEPIPIGRPVSNTTAYVLNSSLNPVLPGLEGEIYLGGLGLAKGYLNDSELTAKRFIPNPFGEGLLYKTGDSGKWLENGDLMFCGRRDDQVKINGFRIELGEIEKLLNQHSKVHESIVLVKEDHGQKQLIAFCKVAEGVAVTSEELRSHLIKKLPSYMIPSQFKVMGKFPLTANGKADKARLLTGINFPAKSISRYESPQTSLEKELVLLWEEVLQQTPISVTASFFQLGGHSLLAVKLMSKIEKAFNRDLPVSVLFEAPSIRELAAVIEKENSNKDTCLVKIQPNGSKPPLFLIPGYLFYHHLARHLGDDQPIYGFEPISERSTEKVAKHYIDQIIKIQHEGPYYLGGYCAGGIVAYEMAQQLKSSGHSIGLLAMFESYTREGTLPKTSPKYLQDKIQNLTSSILNSGSLAGGIKIMGKEAKRAYHFLKYKLSQEPNSDYSVQPYYDKIKLFRAKDGMIGATDDPYMGWSKYCVPGNLEIIEVPGDHNTIFKDPNVELTALKLKKCLENQLVLAE